ncbi:MAG: hypothetical protein ACJAS9_000685 [Polaribacter sp.]|jgi:phosphate-selective porin
MGEFSAFKPKYTSGAIELTCPNSEHNLKKEEQVVNINSLGVNFYFDKSVKLMLNFNNANNREK